MTFGCAPGMETCWPSIGPSFPLMLDACANREATGTLEAPSMDIAAVHAR